MLLVLLASGRNAYDTTSTSQRYIESIDNTRDKMSKFQVSNLPWAVNPLRERFGRKEKKDVSK